MRGYLNAATRRRPRGALAAALVAAAIAVPSASGVLHPVVYGSTFSISGAVPSGNAGEAVQILARPFGHVKYVRIGGITTTTGGTWTYAARPAITTTYLAVWHGNMTATVSADVTPRLELVLRKRVLTVSAHAATPLTGRSLLVQLRRSGAPWRNVRTIVLGTGSTAHVPFTAPHGRSEIRLYISKGQAGAGYISGFSGVLVYRNNG